MGCGNFENIVDSAVLLHPYSFWGGFHDLTNGNIFPVLDGSGYVDDGREIFDDDPNEDPEGDSITFYLKRKK